MQSIRYLEAVRARTVTKSDYAIAKALGLTPVAVGHYLHGRRVMDNYACLRVAEALGVPLQEVIAAAEYDREKNEAKRETWTRFLYGAGIRIRQRKPVAARA